VLVTCGSWPTPFYCWAPQPRSTINKKAAQYQALKSHCVSVYFNHSRALSLIAVANCATGHKARRWLTPIAQLLPIQI